MRGAIDQELPPWLRSLRCYEGRRDPAQTGIRVPPTKRPQASREPSGRGTWRQGCRGRQRCIRPPRFARPCSFASLDRPRPRRAESAGSVHNRAMPDSRQEPIWTASALACRVRDNRSDDLAASNQYLLPGGARCRAAAWPGRRPGRHHARRDEAPTRQAAAGRPPSSPQPTLPARRCRAGWY